MGDVVLGVFAGIGTFATFLAVVHLFGRVIG